MKGLIYGALGVVFSLFVIVTTMGNGMDLYEMLDYYLAEWVGTAVRWFINSICIGVGALAVYTIIRVFDNFIKGL
jgi:hypothetical protein